MKLSLENEEIINKIFTLEESKRPALLKKIKLYNSIKYICYTISIIAIFIFFVSITNIWIIMTGQTVIPTFFLIGISLTIAYVLKLAIKITEKKFQNSIKRKVLPLIIKEIKNIEKATNAISYNDLLESDLFETKEYLTEDDSFIFNYKDKKAYFSEAETYKLNRKNHQRYNIKRWLFISFFTNYNTNTRTIITSKNFIEDVVDNSIKIFLYIVFFNFLFIFPCLYFKHIFEYEDLFLSSTIHCVVNIGLPSIFIFIGLLYVLYSIPAFRKLVKKEYIHKKNVKITKDFNIKSSNEIEAKYILTPAFLQNLRKLKTIFNANSIKCSLYKDRILLALSINEDLFEVASIYEPVTTKRFFRKTIQQINAIKKLILILEKTNE